MREAGRTVLLPTVVGAVLLSLFALDLGWATFSLAPATMPMGAAAMIIEHLVEGSILPRASQRGSGQVRPAAVALRDDDGRQV